MRYKDIKIDSIIDVKYNDEIVEAKIVRIGELNGPWCMVVVDLFYGKDEINKAYVPIHYSELYKE